MENFIVSARKYRPITFDMVVGQAAITNTLESAIKAEQLAHAYLFCGPRGVGKTTCARIFAKTINCMNLDDNLEPCDTCESCLAFNRSNSLNIHELDAASNNSVDDIRNLIEQVRIPPQLGKYSIYIIDEVHMLSQAAFNAFLKTLEEPPAHAVFILATTEKHKIIPTILSRCQIFDFNRIQIKDIVQFLEEISKKEKVEYEKDAFNIIAQKADGAMRDALSIYDQVVSFSGNNITYKSVIENLNVLDYDYYFRITDYCLTGKITEILLLFDEILAEGYDSHNFMNHLSKHFRDLLVSKDKETLPLLEAGETLTQKYSEQAEKCPQDLLYAALEICNQCDINYRLSKNQRLHVELTLIKLGNLSGEKKNSIGESDNNEELFIPESNTQLGASNGTASETVPEPKQQEPPKATAAKKSSERAKPIPETKSAEGLQSFSLKDALNKGLNPNTPAEKPGATSQNDVQANSFTQEELLNKWTMFLAKVEHDFPRMHTFLKNNTPVLKEGYQLILTFNNKSQVDDFNAKIKEKLLKYLWKELQNQKITIKEQIQEQDSSNGSRVYTDEDKFKYLSEKNPLLNKLKQDFNLDFE